MLKKHKFKFFTTVLILVLFWLGWPFYEFYAHRDVVPLSPFGWLEIPEEAPSNQTLYNPVFAEAGKKALGLLEKNRKRMEAPGISAAVAFKGEIVWAGASGWADLETRDPVTPETRFRIGSTSKALTGAALARLYEGGLVDLDAPISTYMDKMPNPAWEKITPRQLVSHMAGLPHYGENTDWLGLYETVALNKHYETVYEALEIFDSSEMLFEPGTDFFYSTLGTVLLGAVLSGAAEKPYLEVMQEQVFGPSGMNSTVISPTESRAGGDFATFYKYQDEKVRVWRNVDLSQRLPGGGFAAPPTDLVKLGMAMLDDAFISPKTRDVFWTQQVLADGSVNEQGYALGWRTREWDLEGFGMVMNANHGGVSRGSQSWLLIFPDHEMVLAFTINTTTEEFSDFGWETYQDLAGVFLLALSE